MPASMASRGEAKRTLRPCHSMVPRSGAWTPLRSLISVDFPAPFSPMSPRISPASSSRVAGRSAGTPAKDFSTDSRRRRAMKDGILPQLRRDGEPRRRGGGETERNTAAKQPAGARMGSLLLTNASFSEKTLSAPHRVARSNTYPGPNAMHVTIAVVGCLDTKGEEVQLLKSVIEGAGHRPHVVDAGVLGDPPFAADTSRQAVAI